jgi:uncharacterized protein YjbI with pentapeptide repeats
MDTITIRRTTADLPAFDEDVELQSVSSLSTATGAVHDFQYADERVRALDVENVRLLHGKIRAVRAERVGIAESRMDSVEFSGCDLSSVRWEGGKLSRVRFDTCKLLGAQLDGVSLEHVVFVGCKLDFATFNKVKATGPVLFVRCALSEAEFIGCDLPDCLLDDCDLRLTVFGAGNYRGCDLRGNDLSAISGTQHLKKVTIDRAQTMQLAEALATELGVSFGDDAPDQA